MWVHLWASSFTTTWAEDISENIIVSKMSCFNHAGQLTVPCYSLGHSHWQGCLFCNILLMPMQFYSVRLSLLQCWSVQLLKFHKYQILQESYISWQHLISWCILTSFSIHWLYWVWFFLDDIKWKNNNNLPLSFSNSTWNCHVCCFVLMNDQSTCSSLNFTNETNECVITGANCLPRQIKIIKKTTVIWQLHTFAG